jgi:hypothetical protein
LEADIVVRSMDKAAGFVLEKLDKDVGLVTSQPSH